MVLVGDDLFISRISHDGDYVVSGIYCLTTADSNLASPSWITITENLYGEDDDFVFYNLFTANGYLYVNELAKDDDDDDDDFNTTDSLVYVSTLTPEDDVYSDFSGITSKLGITSTEHVIGMTYSDNQYWLIFNDYEDEEGYACNDTTYNFSTVAGSPTNTDYMVSDLFYYDATNGSINDYILISDVNGSIYVYDESSDAWDSDIDVDDPDIDCMYRGFADIYYLATDMVIVGTSAYDDESGVGYYQIDMSSLSIDEDDDFSDNYSSSDLSDSSIAGFLMDDSNTRLFAYTENEGVWLNVSVEWSLE
jgi:hypothetical protein